MPGSGKEVLFSLPTACFQNEIGTGLIGKAFDVSYCRCQRVGAVIWVDNRLSESDFIDERGGQLIEVEAQHLFYCQCTYPPRTVPEVIPAGPERVKLKSMPKLKGLLMDWHKLFSVYNR